MWFRRPGCQAGRPGQQSFRLRRRTILCCFPGGTDHEPVVSATAAEPLMAIGLRLKPAMIAELPSESTNGDIPTPRSQEWESAMLPASCWKPLPVSFDSWIVRGTWPCWPPWSLAIDVTGRLIEVIAGRPLQQFLRERLFAPLGMTDTGFAVPFAQRNRIATRYGLPDIVASTLNGLLEAWNSGLNQPIDVETTYPSTNTSSFARGAATASSPPQRITCALPKCC